MPLSQEEIEKIGTIRKKLAITFKAATKPEQRARLKKDLETIDEIIENIKAGKTIDPAKLKLFSIRQIAETQGNTTTADTTTSTYDTIPLIKVTTKSRDYEMDLLYSYFIYFEKNFYSLLSLQNLKLRFDTGKKRDDILAEYDMLLRQIENYQNDLADTSAIANENQRAQLEERLVIERYQIIGKMNNFFKTLLSLTKEMNSGIAKGEKIVLNPTEQFCDQNSLADYGVFEGKEISIILIELEKFLITFIGKIKLPNFMKGKKI